MADPNFSASGENVPPDPRLAEIKPKPSDVAATEGFSSSEPQPFEDIAPVNLTERLHPHRATPEKEENDLKIEKLRVVQMEQDLDHRDRYAKQSISIAKIWLAGVGVMVAWAGLPLGPYRFQLSDPVLIALLTTTTFNVIGLALVVMKYLFHRPP